MKISLSCRITEHSDNKEKSFMPINSLVELALKNGFEGISLRPSVISSNSSKKDIHEIKRLFNFHKMNISMITSNIHLAKNDNFASDNLRNIKPCLDLADYLGTNLVRIMVKSQDDIIYAQKALDEALERGITLSQQTHWGTLAETIDETLTLINKINRKNFGITFEPANLMACGSDYSITGLKKLLPYLVNFYFQNIILDHHGLHEFKTNAKGNIKVKYVALDNSDGILVHPFIKFLNEMNYKGWFTIHQPLIDNQTIEDAIKEASSLFEPFKS